MKLIIQNIFISHPNSKTSILSEGKSTERYTLQQHVYLEFLESLRDVEDYFLAQTYPIYSSFFQSIDFERVMYQKILLSEFRMRKFTINTSRKERKTFPIAKRFFYL